MKEEIKEVLVDYQRLITVDPGLHATGIAVISEEHLHSAVIRSKTYMEMVANIGDFLGDLKEKFFRPSFVCIENQKVWTTAKSIASATRGDIFHVAHIAGAVTGIVHMLWPGVQVGFLDPEAWKGQLPKKVVQERVKSAFDLATVRDHEADALGIMLYYIRPGFMRGEEV